MPTLTRRTQLLLSEDQYRTLRRQAEQTGRSMGSLIRDAVDQAYGSDAARRAQAAAELLAAPTMPVADWDALEREIEERGMPDDLRGHRE